VIFAGEDRENLVATQRSVVSDDDLVCRPAPSRGSRPGGSRRAAVLPPYLLIGVFVIGAFPMNASFT